MVVVALVATKTKVAVLVNLVLLVTLPPHLPQQTSTLALTIEAPPIHLLGGAFASPDSQQYFRTTGLY